METKILVEDIDVEKPVVLTSFPGIGLVGTITAAHYVSELNLEPVGLIESEMLLPIALAADGVIQPPVRVYQSKEKNFVLIHSDVPIIPELAYEMSKKIVEWAASIETSRILSIAGVATFEGDKRRVFGAATTKELLDEIKDYVEIFKNGTISGIAGSILNECVARKFPGFAILGETMGFNPDPRAAAQVVNVLNSMFGWDINVEKLLKQAEIIEAQLQKLADQTRMHEQVVKREELPMFG